MSSYLPGPHRSRSSLSTSPYPAASSGALTLDPLDPPSAAPRQCNHISEMNGEDCCDLGHTSDPEQPFSHLLSGLLTVSQMHLRRLVEGAAHKPGATARVAATVSAPLAIAAVVLIIGHPLSNQHLSAQHTPGEVRVAHTGPNLPRLVDGRGRTLLLRGVAVTSLIQYANDYAENPPAGGADFAEMAALGFNFVRLPVSWSAIAPRPGSVNMRYLAQVVTYVRAAHRHGLFVLVDMHFDRYNRQFAPGNEADGAPDWAVLVPPGCWSQLASADCTRAAWESFWQNRQIHGVGLQQYYIAALRALSRRLRNEPGLAGIELMNNPSWGGAPPPAFEATQLWPFYRRAIGALRADHDPHPLWIDRPASAETTDALPAGLPGRLSADQNLVLAPHDYSAVFSKPPWPAGGVSRLTQWYADAIAQATSLRTALVIGEWGSPAGGTWDAMTATKVRLQDALALGSSFWMWKQRPGFYNWNLVNLNGTLRQDSVRAQLLALPHVDAVPGRLLTSAFVRGRLTVRVTGSGGTATLWSGTQVMSDGTSLLAAPLTRAKVNGRTVPASHALRDFRFAGVALHGYLVSVHVPRGTQTVTLS